MGKVSGCRLLVPSSVNLGFPKGAIVTLPGLGQIEGLVRLDAHSLGFGFVPTTEAGELLGQRMREGACWMRAVFTEPKIPGVTRHGLSLRIEWDPTKVDEHERLIIEPHLRRPATPEADAEG